jgi:hypothetical protein
MTTPTQAAEQPQATAPTDEEQMAAFESGSYEDGELETNADTAGTGESQDTEGAADDTTAEAAGEDEGDKPKKTVQDRINELTRQRREADRRNAELERRLAAIEAGKPEPKPDAQPDPDAPPDPSAFEYGELDVGYIKAVARHEARQEHASLRKSEEERQQQAKHVEHQREVATRMTTLIETGTAKFDDFEDLVKDPTLPVTPELAMLVLDSDVGADIAYHLAQPKNRAELIAMVQKNPLQLAKEFGKLEVRFAKKTEEKKAPGAPPPVQQPRGSGGKFSTSEDTDDFAAFEKMAMAQLR